MAFATSQGILLKKKFGQHFLRNEAVRQHMVEKVDLKDASVFEIGCGDGFLTSYFIQQPLARLWVFEIDPDWAGFIREQITDKRLTVFEDNILDIDFTRLEDGKPWVLLAGLPYQITFPIMHLLQKNKHLIREAVMIMQEEVAQKLVKTGGRGYGFPSLFFQHHFEMELMDKIPGSDFHPAPKVVSRMLYVKPRAVVQEIPEEEQFWKFIKLCFLQPRRTLRNNLAQSHYDLKKISEEVLQLRSQQLSMKDLLRIWEQVRIAR